MNKFIPPLTVIFIWHPKTKIASGSIEESLIKPLAKLLSRDEKKPFSRSVNLPVFFYTAEETDKPQAIPKLDGKTLIFPFIDENIVDNVNWATYVKNIETDKNVSMIPIALHRTIDNLKNQLDCTRIIEAFNFEKAWTDEQIFIAITHEICRQVLDLGEHEKIKLFLSYTKYDEAGIKIAEALKNFIENNSYLQTFLKTIDIAHSVWSTEKISKDIEKSTVIAIHSDVYSSRLCQSEILCAKQKSRPIIAVDALEKFEDRRFPFAANIPIIHIHHKGASFEKDLFEVIKVGLIETLRHNYSDLLLTKYEKNGWINTPALILTRPPEVADIKKLSEKNACVQSKDNKSKRFVYPDPPVYPDEIDFLKSLNIEADTPLTSDLYGLEGKSIGVSISNPSKEELLKTGQSDMHLEILAREIARYLLCCNATLIYGGDLREGGFTDFICQEVRALQDRLGKDTLRLHNYRAWPIHLTDSEKTKIWLKENKNVLNKVDVEQTSGISDLTLDVYPYLPKDPVQSRFVQSRCLTKMREQMIIKSDNKSDNKSDDGCDVRICAGGKLFGYSGMMPGVLEEILIAKKQKIGGRPMPLYLVGGFGGVTAKVCEAIQTGVIPPELTLDYQIEKNLGLKETLNFAKEREDSSYHSKVLEAYNPTILIETLGNLKEIDNGLSEEDNERLFNSQYVDEIVFLILKGLDAKFNKMEHLIDRVPELKTLRHNDNDNAEDDEKNSALNRIMRSINLLTWVRMGGRKNYVKFTECQEHNRLSWESFNEIRNFTKDIIKDERTYNAMLAYLIINTLNKVKNADNGTKTKSEKDDKLFHFDLINFSEMSSPLKALTKGYEQLILDGLNNEFNMEQFIESENFPNNLEPLANIDKSRFNFYILHALYDIGGADGHVSKLGSKIIDAPFWNNFKVAMTQLEKIVAGGNIYQAYDGFLEARANMLNFDMQSDEDKVVVKLCNMMHINDEKTTKQVKDTFNSQSSQVKKTLVDELLRTGIETDGNGILLYSASATLCNAVEYFERYRSNNPVKEAVNIVLPVLAKIFVKVRKNIKKNGQHKNVIIGRNSELETQAKIDPNNLATFLNTLKFRRYTQ